MISQTLPKHDEAPLDSTALAAIDIFRSARQSTLQQLADAGRKVRYRAGEYVYHQGQYSGNFYLVLAGEAELISESEGCAPAIIGRIGPGGHFGETALLSGTAHHLSCRALIDLTLLLFSEQSFKAILLEDTSILQQLSSSQAKRLRVAFADQATTAARSSSRKKAASVPLTQNRSTERIINPRIWNHRLDDKKYRRLLETAVATSTPLLISGEMGTGRRDLAYAIHCEQNGTSAPYNEIDFTTISTNQPEVELFGYDHESPLFSPVHNLGLLDKSAGGTLVLSGIEHLGEEPQRQLLQVMESGLYTRVGSNTDRSLNCRLIFIVTDDPRLRNGHSQLLPELYGLLKEQQLHVEPVRDRRRDIPQLLEHYLERYSLQYKKDIKGFDEHTLGMIINYDWPGNLEELASVVQRAVILAQPNQTLDSSILPGVPQPEGKWEYNLLRLPMVRAIFNHPLFPALPRIGVGIFLVLTLAALILGPETPHENLGLLLSWDVGWPLLIFCFFFFARLWCSICGLAVPGWLAQKYFQPKRPTPSIIKNSSGWIVAAFCITLFWVELAWNSYGAPLLTTAILLTIISGSLLFSIFYERRVWCRFLCPLGGLNALFSMSSIIELRANGHLCLNQCREHNCYTGGSSAPGCPMFRHPFTVDNNRDCILCGNCIKNCNHQAIQLNLRLAPQELWNQRQPRIEDSLLICALAAILPLFILRPQLEQHLGLLHSPLPTSLLFSCIYFAAIALSLSIYGLYSGIIAAIAQRPWRLTAAALSHGFIPLILATFLGAHIELFISAFMHIPAAIANSLGLETNIFSGRLLSRDGTIVLQAFAVLGGLAASLAACRQILKRLSGHRQGSLAAARLLTILLLCTLAAWYFNLL